MTFKRCVQIVWDKVTGNNRCGKEAFYQIGKTSYCEKCGKTQARANFDYSLQYLNSILMRLNDLDLALLPGKELEIAELKKNIQNSIELLNKIQKH